MNNLQLMPYTRFSLSIISGLLLTLIAITTIHAQKPGDLDSTFNNTGIVTTTIGGRWQWGIGVAIQPDNKIVVVGEHGGNDSVNIVALRYTISGTLDSTFNNSGFVTTAIGTFNSAWSTAIQPNDGKIVVAGFSRVGDSPDDYTFSVVRYTVTGSYDTSFNGTGIITTRVGNQNPPFNNLDRAFSVALQPDNKIVVAGHTGDSKQDNSHDFALVRYSPTGTLDSGFNTTGIVTTTITNGIDEGYAVAIQPDGKIVVAGSSGGCASPCNSDSAFVIVRYTITGVLDSSFNGTGIVTTSIGSGEDKAFSVAIQPDGKIVAAGHSEKGNSGNYDFAVTRYTITGTLDSTFNHTGIVTTSIVSNQRGYKMAIQPDGKIVVAGYIVNDVGYENLAIVRYTASGVLDTTLNRTGIVTTPIGNGGDDEGVAVAIQPDGKIVVVGIDGEGVDSNIAVVRYFNDWHTTIFVPVILKE